MQRFLSLDIGKQRTGVALVDDENRVATPLETIAFAPDTKQFIKRIADLIVEWEPKSIIVGLPVDLTGKESVAATQMREVVKGISKHFDQIDFEFVDERLTTAQAEKSLISADFSPEYRKKHRDALAAALIAQTWVDTL